MARLLRIRSGELLVAYDDPLGVTAAFNRNILVRINRELGALTVLITHNAIMADMADRVIHLSDGRVHHTHVNQRRAPAVSLTW